MPVPSWVIAEREREFIAKIRYMAFLEFRSICHEFKFECPFSTSEMLRAYAKHLLQAGIKVPRGDYQPHALYFRTWAISQIVGLEKVINRLAPKTVLYMVPHD